MLHVGNRENHMDLVRIDTIKFFERSDRNLQCANSCIFNNCQMVILVFLYISLSFTVFPTLLY